MMRSARLMLTSVSSRYRLSRAFAEKKPQMTAEEIRKQRIYEQTIRDKIKSQAEENVISAASTKEWRRGVASSLLGG